MRLLNDPNPHEVHERNFSIVSAIGHFFQIFMVRTWCQWNDNHPPQCTQQSNNRTRDYGDDDDDDDNNKDDEYNEDDGTPDKDEDENETLSLLQAHRHQEDATAMTAM